MNSCLSNKFDKGSSKFIVCESILLVVTLKLLCAGRIYAKRYKMGELHSAASYYHGTETFKTILDVYVAVEILIGNDCINYYADIHV